MCASQWTVRSDLGTQFHAHAFVMTRCRLAMKVITTTALLVSASARNNSAHKLQNFSSTPISANANVMSQRLHRAMSQKHGVSRHANASVHQSIVVQVNSGTLPSASASARHKTAIIIFSSGIPRNACATVLQSSARKAPSGTQSCAHASVTARSARLPNTSTRKHAPVCASQSTVVKKKLSIIRLVNACARLKIATMSKLRETTLTGTKSIAAANAILRYAKKVNSGIRIIVAASAHPKNATVLTTLTANYVHACASLNSVQTSSSGTHSGARASVCLSSALRPCPGMKSAAAVNASLKHASPFLTLLEKALSVIGTTLSVNASACQILHSQRALSGTLIFATGFARQLHAKIVSTLTSMNVNASARSRSVHLSSSSILKHVSASASKQKDAPTTNTGTT